MSDEGDDLFGGLGVAEVTQSGYSTEDDQVDEAWKLWADTTKRPDRRQIDRTFSKEYRRWLQANYPHSDMLRVIEGAARLERRPRDPRDVRRVTMALSNTGWEAAALAALKDGDPIIEYPRPEADEPKATLRAVAECCGLPRKSWTTRDFEAAGILIQEMDDEQIEELVDQVAVMLSLDVISPSDVLKNMHSARLGKSGGAKSGRSTYEAGRSESESLEDVIFEADIAAERMMLKGAKPSEILALHSLAPEGYWQAVIEVMEDDPDLDCRAAYDALEGEWGWHPSERE